MRKYGLLFFLIAIASFLRFSNLDNRGLFTDEKFTLLNANGIWVGGGNQTEMFKKPFFTPQDFWAQKNIKDYFESIAHSDFGTHIVYNSVLHIWMLAFGNSDYSVRFLSAIFSLLTVILVYFLTLKVFRNYTMAFISGFLISLDPLNIAQSHIARSYTLSFLLVLLSTYYFLRIFQGNKNKLNFIIYALLVGMAMLNHYLNFLVPLCHALVFLFAKSKKHLWWGFISAAVFNTLLMLYWFSWGGGYIAIDFLKDKNEKHLKLAQLNINNPDAAVQLSSPSVVAKKTADLFFDSSILTQNLFDQLNYGLKNVLVTVLLFGLLLAAYYFKEKVKFSVLFIILAAILLIIFRNVFVGLFVANMFYFSLFFGVKYLFEKDDNQEKRVQKLLIGICTLMLFLPVFFVVYDALKNGHTTSLTFRYIGIASPFVAILLGFGLTRFFKFSFFIFPLIIALVFTQYKPVKNEIVSYFEDKSAMSAWFEPSRVPNPYFALANRITKDYQKKDTLIIPGGYQEFYVKVFENKKTVSYNDAQYINLYLSKDSEIVEKIDINEPDKVFLKKENGEKVLIFDFEGTKYRY